MQKLIGPLILILTLVTLGCTRHHVKADTTHRVEIAPIHVTVDINLKVQRALDDALSFQGGLEDIFTREELEMLQRK